MKSDEGKGLIFCPPRRVLDERIRHIRGYNPAFMHTDARTRHRHQYSKKMPRATAGQVCVAREVRPRVYSPRDAAKSLFPAASRARSAARFDFHNRLQSRVQKCLHRRSRQSKTRKRCCKPNGRPHSGRPHRLVDEPSILRRPFEFVDDRKFTFLRTKMPHGVRTLVSVPASRVKKLRTRNGLFHAMRVLAS